MDIAYVDEKLSWAKTTIIGVLGLAYVIYHVVLKYKGYPVAKAVWCVAGLWLFTFLGNFIGVVISYIDVAILSETGETGLQFGLILVLQLLQTLFNLAWAMCLLLIAYGYDIVVPSLSETSRFWIKRVFLAAAIIPGVMIINIIATLADHGGVIEKIASVLVVIAAVFFLIFFIIRFFKGVQETLEEIRVQSNLIPVPRRIQFENRFKRFLVLSIVVIVVNALMVVSVVLMGLYWPLQIVYTVLGVLVLGLVVSLGFLITVSVFFHATKHESLALYGAPQPHEIGGFNSIQAQDDEIFA